MQKSWKRHLLVGFIVSLIFFGWFLRGFLWMNWRFKLFSTRSWQFVWHEFESGWMLDALSDWIFLISLCLALPCFLYLWYLCTKVRWRALVKKIIKKIIYVIGLIFAFKKRKKSKKTTDANTAAETAAPVNVSAASVRPRAMAVQNKAVLNLPQYGGAKSTFQMPTTAQSVPYGSGTASGGGMEDFGMPPANIDMDNESYANNMDVSQIPLDEVRLPERQAEIEDLDAIWAERGYAIIKNVNVASGVLDYVAVSKDTIYACLLDKEQFDWLADEESFHGEDPFWFSEVDHRVSPVFLLNKRVEELKERLGDLGKTFTIKPLLIEQKGNIINAEDMMKSWLEMGVWVCRTDLGGPDDLSTFGEFLKPEEPVSAEVLEQINAVLGGGVNNG